MKIHYTGQQGGPFGYGVFGVNMVNEFKRAGVWSDSPDAADVIFQPLADNNLTPSAPLGRRNFAISFFEFELGPDAKAHADKFETVFVGSTWCKERCAERGILNTRVLIQGVDSDIFEWRPRMEREKFRFFSGGKFEYRKGQDIVIAAFAEFVKANPDARLVAAWWNPWPELIYGMASSPCLKRDAIGVTQMDLFTNLAAANGIPCESFLALGPLSQPDLAAIMASTDCGIFPNRCEGGTNLVLMEYLSTGRPAVANLKTGHADLRGAAIHEIPCDVDENGWAVQSVESVIDAMETAYATRNVSTWHPEWTWRKAAFEVMDALEG